jgi:hypothetical protein
MYSPDRDQGITNSESALEYKTKGLLMEVFNKLLSSQLPAQEVKSEIIRLENILRKELARKIRDYQKRLPKNT